ncbi:MAG TPA: M14 family metallopeptidase [Bacteroidales bacterium]|nr:M14 family metallopeptidase [Bacteroidales bacterium]
MNKLLRFVFFLIIILVTAEGSSGQDLLTVAERTGYKSTSGYSDVVTFIDGLRALSPFIRVESMGRSVNGHDIPLLVIGDPFLQASGADRKNKLVVYIQAGIHADEVEGKEASLMFARDILRQGDPVLFRNLLILICPIFNIDGNEKISPLHRTYQNGPVNGVGVRYNGQSLDLNRDAMKAESPEIRGLYSNVFNKWDPEIFMDCHTTNGSYHVEPVTFTWMVNPNGDTALIGYMRRKMMPGLSAALVNKYGIENCFYGEFVNMLNPGLGWIYEISQPRYLTNYYGLRNRLAILNENYVYADFRSRVNGCYSLMRTLIEYAVANKPEIKDLLNSADRKTVMRGLDPGPEDSLGIVFDVRSAGDVTIRTYEAELVQGENGWNSYRRTDRQIDVTVPYLIDYYATAKARFPFAYVLAVNDPEIIELLRIHGIRMEKLEKPVSVWVEKFEISRLTGAARLNQGHYTNTLEGSFRRENTTFPEGTIIIRTSQPLAGVAACLLEPQSDDGLVVWNFLDQYLVPQWGPGYNDLPVYKITGRIDLPTVDF